MIVKPFKSENKSFSQLILVQSIPRPFATNFSVRPGDEDHPKTFSEELEFSEYIQLDAKSKTNGVLYRLKAAIVHQGFSKNFGHYYAITREGEICLQENGNKKKEGLVPDNERQKTS